MVTASPTGKVYQRALVRERKRVGCWHAVGHQQQEERERPGGGSLLVDTERGHAQEGDIGGQGGREHHKSRIRKQVLGQSADEPRYLNR